MKGLTSLEQKLWSAWWANQLTVVALFYPKQKYFCELLVSLALSKTLGMYSTQKATPSQDIQLCIKHVLKLFRETIERSPKVLFSTDFDEFGCTIKNDPARNEYFHV